jgi:hypothetical protein
MAARLTTLSRVLVAALAASALAPSGAAFARGDDYGPYRPDDASHRRGHVWREGYCGEREMVQAPDIMTFDRKTGSEVLVGHGPGASSDVTGINRETGSVYNVGSGLAGAQVSSFCTVSGETGAAYSVAGGAGGAEVKGQDASGRRFEVKDAAAGPLDYKQVDPATGRIFETVTHPDGRIDIIDPIACTRHRLGFDVEVGGHAHVDDVVVGGTVGADSHVTWSLC